MTLVLLITAAVVLLAVLTIGLVTTRRGKAPTTLEPPAGTTPPSPDAITEAPEEAALEEPAGPVTPTLERPEGTASRLVRLRQRLASSQGGLGRGLLALLSRDRLDEDDWESI